MTGSPEPSFHPRRCQPLDHFSATFITYMESVTIFNSPVGWAIKAMNTAVSSPIWFVPAAAPPASLLPSESSHAHPIAPRGLCRADPSVHTVTARRCPARLDPLLLLPAAPLPRRVGLPVLLAPVLPAALALLLPSWADSPVPSPPRRDPRLLPTVLSALRPSSMIMSARYGRRSRLRARVLRRMEPGAARYAVRNRLQERRYDDGSHWLQPAGSPSRTHATLHPVTRRQASTASSRTLNRVDSMGYTIDRLRGCHILRTTGRRPAAASRSFDGNGLRSQQAEAVVLTLRRGPGVTSCRSASLTASRAAGRARWRAQA